MKRKIVLFSNKISNEGGYKASLNFFNMIKNDYKLSFYTRSFIKKKIINHIKIKIYYLLNSMVWRFSSKSYNVAITLPAFDYELKKDLNNIKIFVFQYINELISFKFIKKNSEKKLFFFLHDEWLFNGIFHFKDKKLIKKFLFLNFIENYFIKKKLETFSTLKDLTIIGNCKWITNKAKNSKVFKKAQFFTLYNSIDTNFFKKNPLINYKKNFGLNESKKYILFLAKGGVTNFRKGGDIFEQLLKNAPKNLNFICISENGYEQFSKYYKNVYVFNKINNSQTLKEFYLASDLNIILSRNECIPFSVLESMSCGIPNVSFNVGGINEVIKHKKNGWLCENNSIHSILKGIDWIFSSKNIKNKLSINSRKIILEKFSTTTHKKMFKDILK